MFGFSNESLTNSITPKVSNILNKPWTPVVLYSPPGSGKTYFKRNVLFGGLPTFDTDDLWSYWDKKLRLKRKDEISSGKLTAPQLQKDVYALVAWSIYANITVGNIGLIVTNLHDLVLVSLARYGCVIVGYLPEYKVWYDRIYNRMKNDVERKTELQKYISWYKEIVAWKGTSYDKINVWVSDVEELKYYLYTKIYSGFGRTKTLREYQIGLDTRSLVFKVMIDSSIYFCLNKNKIPYFCDVTTKQIQHICSRGICNRVSRRRKVPLLKVSEYGYVSPTAFGKGDIDARNEFIRCIVYANNAFKTVFVPHNNDVLKSDSIESEFSFKLTEYKPKGVPYTLFLYRKSKDYLLIDGNESSKLYEQVVREDIQLIRQCLRDGNCKRIVYMMLLKRVVSKPLLKDFGLIGLYIPYENYGAARRCFVFDRVNKVYLPKKSRNQSLSLLYEQTLQFNLLRKKNNVYEMIAFKSGIHLMVERNEVIKPRLTSSSILVCLPRFFKKLPSRERLLLLLKKWSRRTSVMMVPWYDARLYIKNNSSKYSNGYFFDRRKIKWNNYPAFTSSELWKYDIQIFAMHDFITMNRYKFVKDRWFINEKFSSCNPSDVFLYQHMVIGNIIDKSELKYQTVFNSQTHVMLTVSRLLRYHYGFSSKHVYKIRGSIVGSLLGVQQILSPDISFIKDGKAYNVSGHGINILYASRLHPIDIRRWIATVSGNISMFSEYVDEIKRLKTLGLLTEPDGALVRWHVPLEFKYIEVVANKLLAHSQLPMLDEKVIKQLFKEILDLKGYVGMSLEKFDISHK